jgi:hypothetical protein
MIFSMKKNLLIIVLITSMTVTGCEDFLSKVPDNRTIIDTKAKIAELLVTAYPEGNYIPFCEAMSDNVEDNPSTQQDVRNTDPYFWRDVTSTAQDSPEHYWNTCYTAIAAANHALKAIERTDDPDLFSAERGEALVARAYSHFMLVSLFSKIYNPATADRDPGIPYVTVPETESLKTYDRKTVQYVYEQIEKDLTEGLPLIDDRTYETDDADATGVPSYHFTTAAAHAVIRQSDRACRKGFQQRRFRHQPASVEYDLPQLFPERPDQHLHPVQRKNKPVDLCDLIRLGFNLQFSEVYHRHWTFGGDVLS